jgi:predicted kinase
MSDLLEQVKDYDAVVMCGLPGSGKSYWAGKLAKELGAEMFSSDQIREQMFGTTRFSSAGDEIIMPQSDQAYEFMYKKAAELIKQGKKVVIDATNLKPKRTECIKLLLQATKKVVMVVVDTDRKVIEKRMQARKEMTNEMETHYQAWQRLIGYFDTRFKDGEYSWPSEKELGIKIIRYKN